MSIKWVVTYAGLSYLMVSAIFMHAAIVSVVKMLVEDERMRPWLGDILKVANFFYSYFFRRMLLGRCLGMRQQAENMAGSNQ